MERPQNHSEVIVDTEYTILQHPLHYRNASGELMLGETCPSQTANPRRLLQDPQDEGGFWLIGYASCSNPDCSLSVPLTQDQHGAISAGYSTFAGFSVNFL